jgi:Cd2+/Zn2+-exporting ATPase
MNERNATSMIFRIEGMDCAEEVATLKRELGSIVGGEEHLTFDIVNGKMTVLSDQVSAAQIREAVAPTGMKATPWSDETPSGLGVWQQHGRAVMCGASAGFSTHAWHVGGPLAAISGAGGHALPIWTIASYVAAIITGAWFVVPKAVFAMRRLRPDMNLLMTIAVTGAVVIGEWFEAGAVSFLFALALLLESWSLGRARRAIKALIELSPTTARVRSPRGAVAEMQVEDVAVGSTILVPPGERIPLLGSSSSSSL